MGPAGVQTGAPITTSAVTLNLRAILMFAGALVAFLSYTVLPTFSASFFGAGMTISLSSLGQQMGASGATGSSTAERVAILLVQFSWVEWVLVAGAVAAGVFELLRNARLSRTVGTIAGGAGVLYNVVLIGALLAGMPSGGLAYGPYLLVLSFAAVLAGALRPSQSLVAWPSVGVTKPLPAVVPPPSSAPPAPPKAAACGVCGEELLPGDLFCTGCGAAVSPATPVMAPPASPAVASAPRGSVASLISTPPSPTPPAVPNAPDPGGVSASTAAAAYAAMAPAAPPLTAGTSKAASNAAQAKAPRLTVTSGKQQGQSWVLNPGQACTIGRSSQCAITLDDPAASRVHAQIAERGGRFFVSDNGSANGTTVDGTAIVGEHALSDGDVIGIGDSVMRFGAGT